MVGRSSALERPRSVWRLATSGRHQTVWIGGEAGVGKTMLIERFMAEVGEMHCAHGQCVEQYGTGALVEAVAGRTGASGEYTHPFTRVRER